MTGLVQFLKILIGISPELLPVVSQALHAWTKAKKRQGPEAFANDVIKQITPTKEAEIDAKVDAEADAARAAAGLDGSEDDSDPED